MLFGLIYTMTDVSAAVAQAQADYQQMTALVSTANGRGRGLVTADITSRVSAIQSLMQSLQNDVSMWSGSRFAEFISRAKVISQACFEVTGALSSAMGTTNPVKSPTAGAWWSALGLAALGGLAVWWYLRGR